MRTKFLIFFGLGLLLNLPSYAGDLTIDADKQVEVHQNEQKLVALGNATAKQDGNSVRADSLTAYYQKNAEGKNEFISFHGKGNVYVNSANTKAYGQTLDYDLKKAEIVLQGKPAKIVNINGDTITADGKITYYPQKNMAVAVDNVIATGKKENNKVRGDKMISYFSKNAQGENEMQKVDITGNVKVFGQDTVATAQTGTYLPQEGLVKLEKDVIINQNGNIITGAYAETDLNTGISKMKSGEKGKRVSGVFKSEKKEKEVKTKDTDNGK